MGLLNFLSKKKVPDELPDLATDELLQKKPEEKKEELSTLTPAPPEKNEEKETKDSPAEEEKEEPKETPEEIISKTAMAEEIDEKPKKSTSKEDSFFAELEEHIGSELKSLDGLSEWYEKKFSHQDAVSEMRSYWEGQKEEVLLRSLGKNFKKLISEHTEKMQELEREWQEVYFELMEKEEEIREEEKALKKVMAELVQVANRRKQANAPKTKKTPKKKAKKK